MVKKLLLSASVASALFVMASATVAADEKADLLRQQLASTGILDGQEPSSIKPSAMSDVYEITVNGQVLYGRSEGNNLFVGQMVDVKAETANNKKRLEKEKADRLARKKIMEDYGTDKSIVFKADNEKHVISVFTATDCPYCRRFHKEVPALNKAGVTVQYYMYPFRGLGTAGHKKAVSVWCSDDRNAALTKAKSGQSIEDKTCDNPVEEQFALGRKVGVTGTPTAVLSSGELMSPGGMKAAQIVAILDKKEPKK